MVSVRDIAWAAGIFEGEGTTCPSNAKRNYTVVAAVTQKDLWLLRRLQELFGGSVDQYPQQYRNTTRLYGRWRLTGPAARGFLMTIYTFMSPRRKDQIKAALTNGINVRPYKRKQLPRSQQPPTK